MCDCELQLPVAELFPCNICITPVSGNTFSCITWLLLPWWLTCVFLNVTETCEHLHSGPTQDFLSATFCFKQLKEPSAALHLTATLTPPPSDVIWSDPMPSHLISSRTIWNICHVCLNKDTVKPRRTKGMQHVLASCDHMRRFEAIDHVVQ